MWAESCLFILKVLKQILHSIFTVGVSSSIWMTSMGEAFDCIDFKDWSCFRVENDIFSFVTVRKRDLSTSPNSIRGHLLKVSRFKWVCFHSIRFCSDFENPWCAMPLLGSGKSDSKILSRRLKICASESSS